MSLQRPFRRGGRRRPASDVVTFDGRRGRVAGPRPVTPVDRPDTVRPVSHARPAELPDKAEWRRHIAQLVDELAVNGSVDAGNLAVVDRYVDRQLETVLALVEQERPLREAAARVLVGVHQENLAATIEELRQVRARHEELLRDAEIAREQLRGQNPLPPDEVAAPLGRELTPLPAPLDPSAHLAPNLTPDRRGSRPDPAPPPGTWPGLDGDEPPPGGPVTG